MVAALVLAALLARKSTPPPPNFHPPTLKTKLPPPSPPQGIIRRVQEDGGDGGAGESALSVLTGDLDPVGRKLQDMINEGARPGLGLWPGLKRQRVDSRPSPPPSPPPAGRLKPDDVDRRMCRALADLGPRAADEAVDKFAQANLESVRSKAGFMMGIIRRLGDPGGGGGGGGRGGGGGGGGYGGAPAPAYGGGG